MQSLLLETFIKELLENLEVSPEISPDEPTQQIDIEPEKEDEDIEVGIVSSEDKERFSAAASMSARAKVLMSILSSPDFFGNDMKKVIGSSAADNLMRFGLSPGVADQYDFSLLMNTLYDEMVPGHAGTIIELAPDEDPNPSSTYTAYQFPDLGNLVLLFGGAGVTGGLRAAGYEYEIKIKDSLIDIGVKALGGEDNSVSDVYIPVASGKLGIEVKLPNAQAGEPTLRYDYDKGEFFASNPKPQNQDIANLINLDPTAAEVEKKLKKVKNAINKDRKKSKRPKIESILSKVSKKEYNDVVKPVLEESGKEITGALLAKYIVSAKILRRYYMLKKAGLVQIKTKGLFHLHPQFKIKFRDESGNIKTTRFFEFPDAQGSVYFRNFKGANYGIRSQLTKSPLKQLPPPGEVGIDLDNDEDRKRFAEKVKTMSFPDPQALATAEAETPSSVEVGGHQTVSEALALLIREYCHDLK